MRPPPLTFRDYHASSTESYDDPWEEYQNQNHPARRDSRSTSSSRTSSTDSNCHVIPESAFRLPNGKYFRDPYLGRRDIAQLCAGYLMKEFGSNEENMASKRLGQPKLSVFIAQTIYLSGAPTNAVIAALILLQRFRAKLMATSRDSCNMGFSGHILWLGAFLIACAQDSMVHSIPSARSATYWSEMTLFSEREVDEVYQEMWEELEGNVTVFPSYASALEKLRNPIQVPSWEDEDRWTFDEDEDEAYTSSSSDVGAKDEMEHEGQQTDKTPYTTTKGKSKNKGLTGSPASSRTRAVGSRLVSLFKRKA